MLSIPRDPVILLSYMNTQLRDHYSTLRDCCQSLCIIEEDVVSSLRTIQYYYDEEKNQFI